MKKALNESGAVIAKKHIKVAVLVTLVICGIYYLFGGYAQMRSALIAGLIAIIPNSIFAYKTFKYVGAQSSDKVIKSFYQGEKLKMVLTVVLFAVAFRFFSVMPAPLFLTYCIILIFPILIGFFKL